MDGLVQERRNSIANALELRLSSINPSLLNQGPGFFLWHRGNHTIVPVTQLEAGMCVCVLCAYIMIWIRQELTQKPKKKQNKQSTAKPCVYEHAVKV